MKVLKSMDNLDDGSKDSEEVVGVGSGSVDGRGEVEVIVSCLADFDLLFFLLLGDMVNTSARERV